VSDSPRANAAAAIRNARDLSPARQPDSPVVTVRNLSFTIDATQSKWLEDVKAETDRVLAQR
jgi:hypothetical protein